MRTFVLKNPSKGVIVARAKNHKDALAMMNAVDGSTLTCGRTVDNLVEYPENEPGVIAYFLTTGNETEKS